MTPHADLVARLDGAMAELSVCVDRQWNGDAALRIGIPARPGIDSDLVLMGALKAARDALAALPPPADPPALVALVREWQRKQRGCDIENTAAAYAELDIAEAELLAYPLPAAPPVVEPVPIPEPHQRAAATFRALATPVPMSEAERTADDPDYGLTPAAPPVTASAPTYVEIDPDGDLSIDFDRANDRVVSLTVYQDGRVGYSAFVGGKSAHGIVTAAEPMPVWVRAAICAPPVADTPQPGEVPPSSTWTDIGPQPKGWPDANNPVRWKPRPDCVIGVYCQRHGFIHGQEAEELRERLEELGNTAVNRVLDEVDARDSVAYLEATNEPTPPDAAPVAPPQEDQ